MFESVAPAILESPIYRVRGALEILCGCRPQRQVATADSSLKPSRLMKTDRREYKCRKRAVRRESFRWSSVGS